MIESIPIFLSHYQTFQEYNQSDIAGLLTYPAHVVPLFIPLVLFALFSVTLLATYFSQLRLRGEGDFLGSFAVAGFFTAIISLLMTLVDGLITTTTISITLAISIIGIILLMIGRDRD